MDGGDVEAIGAHCQYTYCHQLDFLPFRCESCKGTFCLDHRTESGHACAKAGAWAAARRQATTLSSGTSTSTPPRKATLQTATQCSHPICKSFVNTHTSVGVTCTNCNRTYCLKHRLREDHDCAKLIPIGARPASASASATGPTQAEKAKAALGRLRAWGKEKQAQAATGMSKPRTTKSVAAASAAASLNTLKRTAKGDSNVPLEKRIYLHVEAEAPGPTSPAPPKTSSPSSTQPPQGSFYYSRDWSVGRMLDAAAKSLQVENVNNRRDGEEDRLRIFHVESGRVLGFAEKVGECCGNGNTIVLLRGIGAG